MRRVGSRGAACVPSILRANITEDPMTTNALRSVRCSLPNLNGAALHTTTYSGSAAVNEGVRVVCVPYLAPDGWRSWAWIRYRCCPTARPPARQLSPSVSVGWGMMSALCVHTWCRSSLSLSPLPARHHARRPPPPPPPPFTHSSSSRPSSILCHAVTTYKKGQSKQGIEQMERVGLLPVAAAGSERASERGGVGGAKLGRICLNCRHRRRQRRLIARLRRVGNILSRHFFRTPQTDRQTDRPQRRRRR